MTRIAPLLLMPFLAIVLPGASPLLPNADRESAHFGLCRSGPRIDCVVDGDTFWYRAQKIRIADINTPETGRPGCSQEAELGHAATGRLAALLNAGPFTLGPGGDGREQDRYGRLLRTVTRGGVSLSAALVDEGLAERWTGRRRNWC